MASVAIFNADRVINQLLSHAAAPDNTGAEPEVAMNDIPNRFASAGGDGQVSALGEAVPQVLAAYGAWLEATGSFANVHAGDGAPGYDSQTGGFLAGITMPVTDTLSAGVAVGYEHFNLSENSPSLSSGTDDTGRFAVYGAYSTDLLTLSATAGGGYDSISTTRPLLVGTAKESHSGWQTTAGLAVSHPLDFNGFQLVPQGGLDFVNFPEGSFAEAGAGGADLNGQSHTTSSLQPYIGIAASTALTAGSWQINPAFHVTYSYEALDNDRKMTVSSLDGTQFGINGVPVARNTIDTGFGITAQATPNLTIFGGYDIAVGIDTSTDQAVSAGLKYAF
jgi:subtilase-type serine protease